MATMELYGGERDGDEIKRITEATRPDVYYAVPSIDGDKVAKARGKLAKAELRDKLSILAYAYDADASTDDHFVMRRTPALDKVRQ